MNVKGHQAQVNHFQNNIEAVDLITKTIWKWREDNGVPHPEKAVNPFTADLIIEN